MRELSIVELELIIGGYDYGSGGGYDSGSYGDSSYITDSSGDISGTLTAADEQAVHSEFTAQGFDIPVEIKVGPISIKKNIPVSKSKTKK